MPFACWGGKEKAGHPPSLWTPTSCAVYCPKKPGALTLRTTEIGVVTTRTITYSGTFTVNGSFLTFTCSCYGSPFFGSLGGKTVTIIRDWFGEGIMWVFGKP